MLGYEILHLIWWLLLGTLLIGFSLMDGLDLGAAMLLPFVARTDKERRLVMNTIGPVWADPWRGRHLRCLADGLCDRVLRLLCSSLSPH